MRAFAYGFLVFTCVSTGIAGAQRFTDSVADARIAPREAATQPVAATRPTVKPAERPAQPGGPAKAQIDPEPVAGRDSSKDLQFSPKLLADKTLDNKAVNVEGYRIGDEPDAAHPLDSVGWHHLPSGNAFRVVDGKITTVSLGNKTALKALGIRTVDDVQTVFGKADEVETSATFPQWKDHYYHARKLFISTDSKTGTIHVTLR